MSCLETDETSRQVQTGWTRLSQAGLKREGTKTKRRRHAADAGR